MQYGNNPHHAGNNGNTNQYNYMYSDGSEEGDMAAFLTLARAVVDGKILSDGRPAVEYLGFDPKNPTKFRPAAINADVQTSKEKFSAPGIKAYPEARE